MLKGRDCPLNMSGPAIFVIPAVITNHDSHLSLLANSPILHSVITAHTIAILSRQVDQIKRYLDVYIVNT